MALLWSYTHISLKRCNKRLLILKFFIPDLQQNKQNRWELYQKIFSVKTSLPLSIIQFLLILLFVYAAISKLTNLTVFQAQLSAFPFIGKYSDVLGWCLPLAELGIALLLFLPKYLGFGLYAAITLLLVFTIFLIVMLSFSKNLPCSCGGIIAKLSWKQHIIFNGFFIVIAETGIFLMNQYKPAMSTREPKMT